jgi:hypothetical protein
MESYDPPPAAADVAGLSAEEATARINQVNAQGLQGPYYSREHPQHKDYCEYMHGLFTVVGEAKDRAQAAKDAADVANLLERGGRTPEAQVKLEADVEAEIGKLQALGFTGAAPETVEPFHLTSLKMQRLHAEQDYKALAPIMEGELRSLRASTETLALFQSFVNVKDVDSELRDEILATLIERIHTLNVDKAKANKVSITPDMEE